MAKDELFARITLDEGRIRALSTGSRETRCGRSQAGPGDLSAGAGGCAAGPHRPSRHRFRAADRTRLPDAPQRGVLAFFSRIRSGPVADCERRFDRSDRQTRPITRICWSPSVASSAAATTTTPCVTEPSECKRSPPLRASASRCAPGASRAPRGVRTDHGESARRPYESHRGGSSAWRPIRRQHLRQSDAVRTERGLRALPAHAARGRAHARRRRLRT